jgi:hypothetical protein
MNKKVFISSTCYDLIDLRFELKEFLDEIGLTPILSDHTNSEFTSQHDSNSIEACLINLRDCDTVIFILCQRYGPSLEKYGFGNFSATHLEYLTAKQAGKKILFFVRDRFLADYSTYKKTEKYDSLTWVTGKNSDTRLFEIYDDWHKLTATNTNNWVGIFRSSVELKQRLRIELKAEIDTHRLDKLIESGNIPLLTTFTAPTFIANTMSRQVRARITIENFGSQAAIEPRLFLFRAESYEEVVEKVLYKGMVLGFEVLKPIRPSMNGQASFTIDITDEEYEKKSAKFVIEVIYKTVYGDFISDINNVQIMFSGQSENDIYAHDQYVAKIYRKSNVYKRMVGEFTKA